MLKKTKKGYWVLRKFAQQRNLIHAFSNRAFGDLRPLPSLEKNLNLDQFLETLGLKKKNLVLMEQVHRDKIKVVGKRDRGKVVPGLDGMLCFQKGIILGIKTADCLPILFFDKKKMAFGVAHGGWQGVFERIGQKMALKMKLYGSQLKNVLVGVGPHIGPCCYHVLNQRAIEFKREFGVLKGMIHQQRKRVSLDLTIPLVAQLLEAGIAKKNIVIGQQCTACQKNEFFSFRGEGKILGEMLGIISLT